jgi:hypothetical protein
VKSSAATLYTSPALRVANSFRKITLPQTAHPETSPPTLLRS